MMTFAIANRKIQIEVAIPHGSLNFVTLLINLEKNYQTLLPLISFLKQSEYFEKTEEERHETTCLIVLDLTENYSFVV